LPATSCDTIAFECAGFFLFECVCLFVVVRKRVCVADETAANNGGGNLAPQLLIARQHAAVLTLQQVRADINSVRALP
jgi:hypothetical protein